MSEIPDINWFPGHMKKAERMIEANLSLVDAVAEILDARIPRSSRNPDIDTLSGTKPRLVILNRCDLADSAVTAQWRRHFTDGGLAVLETDARSGRGVTQFPDAVRALLKDKLDVYASKGQATRPLRVMVLGIPNVGKSTFINKAAGRKAAKASDKPGVTRGRQWITVGPSLELLDTPGILWPKFESREVGAHLALTGAVKDEILDREALACELLRILRDMRPEAIAERCKFTPEPGMEPWDMLDMMAAKRGFLVSRGERDTERAAAVLLDEFRAGRMGRVSLERP